MFTAVGSLLAITIFAAALWFGIRLVRSYSRFRGTRIVICPETERPTMVEVDALHASLTSTVGLPEFRLQECARWPLKKECGQQCLVDIDVAPDHCLVSGVLMRWYRDRKCVYCSRAFSEVHWADHRPALLSPEGELRTWDAVTIDQLTNVMKTHVPVCWNCYIAQDFRLAHPDLVVLRPNREGVSDWSQ
jgi:hypothetical protein